MDRVDFTPVLKILPKLPPHILSKLMMWAKGVNTEGIEVMRKIPSYNDEALKGQRLGQRSIRLNRAYRAIYSLHFDGTIRIILIEEVNKHEY